MTGRILALDLGLKTGWAANNVLVPGPYTVGIAMFEVKGEPDKGMRFVRFVRWLETWRLDHLAPPLSLIIYEDWHGRGKFATELAVGLAAHVQSFCASRGIRHVAVHSATLKKFATGNGHADKAMMKQAVWDQWVERRGPGDLPLKPTLSDDEADAIALLHYALEGRHERG